MVSSDRLFKVFARTADGPGSRLGTAVSRKVDPRASVRNRIRRLIRESFRLNHPIEAVAAPADNHQVKSPARDYVVLAATPSATASNARLSESLAHHWREIDRKLADLGSVDSQGSEAQAQ